MAVSCHSGRTRQVNRENGALTLKVKHYFIDFKWHSALTLRLVLFQILRSRKGSTPHRVRLEGMEPGCGEYGKLVGTTLWLKAFVDSISIRFLFWQLGQKIRNASSWTILLRGTGTSEQRSGGMWTNYENDLILDDHLVHCAERKRRVRVS